MMQAVWVVLFSAGLLGGWMGMLKWLDRRHDRRQERALVRETEEELKR